MKRCWCAWKISKLFICSIIFMVGVCGTVALIIVMKGEITDDDMANNETSLNFRYQRREKNLLSAKTDFNCYCSVDDNCNVICNNFPEDWLGMINNHTGEDCQDIKLTLENTRFTNNVLGKNWAADISKKFTYLKFHNSTIQSIEIGAFPSEKFNGLDKLIISFANLESLNKGTFANLTRLGTLEIRDNEKDIKVEPKALEGTTALQIMQMHKWVDAQSVQNLLGKTGVRLLEVETVDLRRNQLIELLEDSFFNVPNVVQIFLDWNHIKTIHPWAFRGITNLQLLYLNNNDLEFVEEGTFQDYIQYNRSLPIASNPWDCTRCELKHLRDLIIAGKVLDIPTCAVTGIPIVEHHFCCGKENSSTTLPESSDEPTTTTTNPETTTRNIEPTSTELLVEPPEYCKNDTEEVTISFDIIEMDNGSLLIKLEEGMVYNFFVSWKSSAENDCQTKERNFIDSTEHLVEGLEPGKTYIVCLSASYKILNLLNCKAKTLSQDNDDSADETDKDLTKYIALIAITIFVCIVVTGLLTFMYMKYVHAPKREASLMIEKLKRDASMTEKDQPQPKAPPLPNPAARAVPPSPLPSPQYFPSNITYSDYERPMGEPLYERIGQNRTASGSIYGANSVSYIYPRKHNLSWKMEHFRERAGMSATKDFGMQEEQQISVVPCEEIYPSLGSSTNV